MQTAQNSKANPMGLVPDPKNEVKQISKNTPLHLKKRFPLLGIEPLDPLGLGPRGPGLFGPDTHGARDPLAPEHIVPGLMVNCG